MTSDEIRKKHNQTMNQSPLYAETLQKIGRNVVEFQKMEGMLKILLASIDSDTVSGEPKTLPANRHELVSKKTLGTVSRDLLEKIFSEPLEPGQLSHGEKHRLSYQFRIGGSSEFVSQIKESFDKIVKERNELIHHRLVDFKPSFDESCERLISYLDSQYGRLEPLLDFLRKEMEAMCEMQAMGVDLLKQVTEKNVQSERTCCDLPG
ncbi:hypothetical protein CEE69_13060 [Rhodopirellula bahusiensis]|uniref:Uncharacterized protein n=1 Tax=Rhodopirellula bahusiensis TaxID=2014065 RepID=A0A2G1W705_9BACT|nr:hypothetical protein CEE69_13060 [Rhodopirellula bahusiensis]